MQLVDMMKMDIADYGTIRLRKDFCLLATIIGTSVGVDCPDTSQGEAITKKNNEKWDDMTRFLTGDDLTFMKQYILGLQQLSGAIATVTGIWKSGKFDAVLNK